MHQSDIFECTHVAHLNIPGRQLISRTNTREVAQLPAEIRTFVTEHFVPFRIRTYTRASSNIAGVKDSSAESVPGIVKL